MPHQGTSLLVALILIAGVCCGARLGAQVSPRKIGELELAIVGLTATVDSVNTIVPKHTPSGLRVRVRGPFGDLPAVDVARFLGNGVHIEGELAGPGLTQTLALSSVSAPDALLLQLPALTDTGDYRLSNLRLVAGDRPVLDVTPGSLTVQVIEQVLVTSVRTRPLTLQEIHDRGIVLDRDDYLGFEFTLGLKLESKAVQVNFPVVFDKDGKPLPEFTQATPNLQPVDEDSLASLPMIVPTLLKIEGVSGARPIVAAADGRPVEVRIPSVLVIPGDVGFLKQFFSAQLFVANGAPVGSGLTVGNIEATIVLPPGADLERRTADDPLVLPTTTSGPQSETLSVKSVGSDGTVGTADDFAVLGPGEQGQAEFSIRGELEGFHTLAFDISAVLDGLATDPAKVTGRATGAVLVRNPFFDLTFTVPSVVRRGDHFTLYATVTNIGQAHANDVSLTIDASRLSGARLLSDTVRRIATLPAGDARVLPFTFESERTGRVVASYLKFETAGDSTGNLRFTLGVGDRGVTLSPDTLVLPSAVDALPPSIVEAAMRVLGQAWSVANAAPGTLPPGVIRITRTAATAKALALAEAGLRVTLGQEVGDALRDIGLDFYGGTPLDAGFDQLLRTTDAGRTFARTLGVELAPVAAAAGGAVLYQRALSQLTASGPDFMAVAVSGPAVDFAIADAAGRRTEVLATARDGENQATHSAPVRAEVPGLAIIPLGVTGVAPQLAVLAAPTGVPYTLELTARAPGAIDIAVTLPGGDGAFARGVVTIADIATGDRVVVTLDPLRATALVATHDRGGNGTIDTEMPLTIETIAPEGARLLSATVVGPETFSTAGPFGLHVALLFDRVVDAASAADRARYTIPDNRFRAMKRQLSGRLVFGQLDQPEGQYVPTGVTTTGIADGRGVVGPPASVALQSRLIDPGAVVSGRVFHADGTPLGAGDVFYLQNLDTMCSVPPAYDQSLAVRSVAADGRFEFRYVRQDTCGFPFRLLTQDPISLAIRTLDRSVRTAGEHIVADIALLGRGSITGLVRALDGAPVGGAAVLAISDIDPQVQGGALTDGDGRYTVPQMAVGPVSVQARKGMAAGSAAGRLLRAGTTATVDVTLDTGSASVAGTIRHLGTSGPVTAPGALVQYFVLPTGSPQGRLVAAHLADANGRYTFDAVPAGAFRIDATLNTPLRERGSISGITNIGDRLDPVDVLVEGGTTATVAGRVQLPDGSPAAGVLAAIGDQGVLTTVEGRFSISGIAVRPATMQVVTAETLDGKRRGQAAIVVATTAGLDNVLVVLSALGSAEITVFDPFGQPLAGQDVSVLADTFALQGVCATGCGCQLATAKTDANGKVMFEGLPAGRITLRATRVAAGFTDVAQATVSIAGEGAIARGAVRFAGAGIVSGTVIGPDARPALGAEITLRSRTFQLDACTLADAVSHVVRTDDQGRFRLTTVGVGSVGLTARHPFSSASVGARGVLTHAGDELTFSLVIPSTTAGELSGAIFLSDGTVPAGAGVEVTANGVLPDVTVRTNEQGRFRFAKIFPQGTYTLTARDPVTGGVARAQVFLKAEQDLAHNLRLKGRGTVSVRVVDALDRAVTNAFVRLMETDFPARTFEGTADAANTGVFTFAQIFEGPVIAEARDTVGRGGRASATLTGAGETLEVKVRLTVTGEVRGRFFMPDGTSPIPFGTVRLLAGGRTIGQSTTAAIDPVGSFEFVYVPAGPIRLEAFDPLTGRAGIAAATLDSEGQALDVDIIAESLCVVEGAVTATGAQQPGADVEIVTGGSYRVSTLTGPDGRYIVEGVPNGPVVVNASILGGLFSGSATAVLAGEGTRHTVDVAVRDAGRITGRVVGADGGAPPPVLVTLRVSGVAAALAASADETGVFVFERVPAGPAVLTVEALGTIDIGRRVITVPVGQTLDVSVTLNGIGTIVGTAHDATGQSIVGDVMINGIGVFPYTLFVTTDANGRFRLPEVLAGPFTARLSSRVGDATLFGVATGTVAADVETVLALSLQESGTVTGVVQRPDGATAAVGAEVTVRVANGPAIVVQAESDGRFAARGVPLGDLTVSITDPFTTGLGLVRDKTLSTNGEILDLGTIVLDNTSIRVVSIDPPDGAVDVPVDTVVRVTLSDPLLSPGGIVVRDGEAALPLAATLSADGLIVTLGGILPSGRNLTVEVGTSVLDIFGRQPVAVTTSGFRTRDVTPPQVVSIAPADAAIQVPTTAALVVTFDEPLDPLVPLLSLVSVTGPAGQIALSAERTSSTVATFTPTTALVSDARYTVVVSGATDLAGNRQPQPSTATFTTVDTQAPALTFDLQPAGEWVANARPLVQVLIADALTGPDMTSATLKLDGVVVTPIKGAAHVGYSPTSDLADGIHTVDATVRDRAGNLSTLAASFGVDRTPPGAALVTRVTDHSILRGTITIGATATDATSGVARIEIRRSGALWATVLPPAFEGSLNTVFINDGRVALTARAVDRAGNVGSDGPAVSAVIDNQLLTVTITTPGVNTRVRDSVIVRATTSEPVDRIDFSAAGGTVSDTTAPYEATVDLSDASDGTLTISVTAVDGTLSSTATTTVVVDRTPPPAPDAARIVAEVPQNGISLVTGQAAAVEANATIEITNATANTTVTTLAAADGSFAVSIAAQADQLLAVVAIDAVGNRSAPTTIIVRRTASVPPTEGATTLRFEGVVADRIGCGAAALSPDGALDAVFTLSLAVGNGVTRRLSFIDLAGPSTRSTRVSVGSGLGVAADAGAPLLNDASGEVSFTITSGATLTLVACDSGFIQEGATYVVTVAFTDGSRFVGSTTIVPAADRHGVAHSAVITAQPAVVIVPAGSGGAGTTVLTLTHVRDIEGTPVSDGAMVAIAVADMAAKDPRGNPIRSAGGSIVDGTPAPNNAAFRVFPIVNGSATATYSSAPVVPTAITGAVAVVQVLAADAGGNVLGTEAIATLDLNLRAATDRAIGAATPASLYADKADRRASVVVQVRDAAGNPLPDGARVGVTATNNGSISPLGFVASAGGTIVGGAASSIYRIFPVAGGQVLFEYSASGVSADVGQVKTVVVQVLAADANGIVTSSAALGTVTIALAGAAASEIALSSETAPVVTPARPVEVVAHHVHDARGNLVPDGANVAITAANNGSTYSGSFVTSAGGTITNGVPPSAGSSYRLFPLAGGRVVATYSTDPVTASPGEVKTANIQLLPADPTNAPLGSAAFAVRALRLVAPAHAIGSALPASLAADGGLHTATVTFDPVIDSFGNPLANGSKVLASAASNAATSGGQLVTSVGGQILNGDPAASAAYKVFAVQGGAVTVQYGNQNITALPGEVKQANVVLLLSTASAAPASSTALGVVPVSLAGVTSAQSSASPAALHADGSDRRANITLSNIRDASGNPVPDGTVVGVSAANNAAVTSDGSAFIASAGGTIVGGGASGSPSFKAFTVANNQIVFEYSTQNISVGTGEQTSNIAVVPLTPSGTVISTRVIATVAIRLLAPSSATVATTPSNLFADGGDRLAQIFITNLTDAGGVPVPDGAKVGLTVANNAATAPDTGGFIVSAGGAIQTAGVSPGDGAVATNNAGFRIFTVAGGEVRAAYSAFGISAGVNETRTVKVSVVPASAAGAVLSTRAFGVGTIELRGLTSATASGPATLPSTGGVGAITFSGLKDSAGNTVPDGTKVAVSVAHNATVTSDGCCFNASVGGTILDGTAVPTTTFKLFTVTDGSVTVTYSTQGALAGAARVQLVPASTGGTIIGNRSLAGGVWMVTVQ